MTPAATAVSYSGNDTFTSLGTFCGGPGLNGASPVAVLPEPLAKSSDPVLDGE